MQTLIKSERTRVPIFAAVDLPEIKQSFTVAEDSNNLNRDQVLKRMLKMPPRLHVKDKMSQRRVAVSKVATESEISDGNFTDREVSDKYDS